MGAKWKKMGKLENYLNNKKNNWKCRGKENVGKFFQKEKNSVCGNIDYR